MDGTEAAPDHMPLNGVPQILFIPNTCSTTFRLSATGTRMHDETGRPYDVMI